MEDSKDTTEPDRRGFFSAVSGWFMAGGLAAGYGACAAMGGRYLFPPSGGKRAWLFVARVDEVRPGDSLAYRAPTGQRIAIARQAQTGDASDFVALSSTCPHLGCQVHWEGQNNRFFCPCHNGVFDPTGNPVSGPPAEANQALPRFPLRIQNGLLYIEVPTEALSRAVARAGDGGGDGLAAGSPPGPGHDPCLYEHTGRSDAPDGSGELA